MEEPASESGARPGADNDARLANRQVVRWSHLKDQGTETDLAGKSPAELIAMVWPLTVAAYAIMGVDLSELRLPRDVVRLVRRQR